MSTRVEFTDTYKASRMYGPAAVDIVFPHDIESSLTEAEGRTLANLATDQTVLELGAWLGRSTVCLAQTAKHLLSCDWHQGDPHAGQTKTLAAYLSNLARYGLETHTVTIVGTFDQVLPHLRPRHFDLIFLDGFHTYEQVRHDLETLLPLLAEHGTLTVHDYGVQASSHGGDPFGVEQAACELLGPPDRVVDTLAIYQQ